jgi:hypothetical protein
MRNHMTVHRPICSLVLSNSKSVPRVLMRQVLGWRELCCGRGEQLFALRPAGVAPSSTSRDCANNNKPPKALLLHLSLD